MNATPTQSAPNPEVAQSLASNIKLRNVFFAAIEGRTLPTADVGSVLSFDVQRVGATWTLVGREIRVVFPYGISIQAASPNSTSAENGVAVAELRISVRLDYSVDDGVDIPDIELIDHYVGVSGFMHSWPYLRAEIQTLTTKLGLPPLVLPVVVSGNAVTLVTVTHVVADQPLPSQSAPRMQSGQ